MRKRHRGFMGGSSLLSRVTKLSSILATLILAGVLIAACGDSDDTTTGGEAGSGAAEGETINLLTWQTYHEPDYLKEFEQDTGIEVNSTNIASPAEMFSKVKANPGQFDLILNTSGWFPQYVESDLLEPIDEAEVGGMENIKLGFDWEAATKVDGELYGVLYNWGNQPLAWIPEEIEGLDLSKYENEKGELDDWNVFWDPQLKDKVSIFDDPTSAEPMVPMALGFKDPYNLDEEEFEAFEEKLMELRPQVKRLTSGYDDQTNQLASGEAAVAMLNIISIVGLLKERGVTLEVNNAPKQGMPAWSDNYAITKEGGGSKLPAIYEFMNYTLTPEWQARFIADSANSGTLDYEQATSKVAEEQGLTAKKLEDTLIPATKQGDAFFSKMKFYQPVEDLNRRLEVWNEFKLGVG